MRSRSAALFGLLGGFVFAQAPKPPTLLGAGAIAPDFVSQTADGQEVRLSDFKGKVVVLDFWATWCAPCIASFPHTQAIAADYKDQGVVVLASGTSDSNAMFKQWIPRNQSKYPDLRLVFDHLHERGSAAFDDRVSSHLYGVEGIPTQFVIGRDGKIVGANVGNETGDARTEALLARAGVKVDAALVAKGEEQIAKAAKQTQERAAAAAARPPFSVTIGTLKEGAFAPDFDFVDSAGKSVKFSSLVGSKAVVFALWFPRGPVPQSTLALWETWYQKYRKQGVEFLSITYLSTPEEFAGWREKNAGKFSFPAVLDASGKGPVTEKTFAEMNAEEKKAYQEAARLHKEKTFIGHLLVGSPVSPGSPSMFVFDGARRFIGMSAASGAKAPEVLGNLLLRTGVDLAPEDTPARVWSIEESKPRPLVLPTHAIKVGDLAPDFTMQDLAGKPVKLSDFRGKTVILDFWATWCGPCQASMPHTQEVTARYKDQGVVTLGSCTSDPRAAFEKWVKQNQKNYPDIVWAHDAAEKGPDRASSKLYGVVGIPKQFIIDRDGKVVDTVTGYLQGEAILDAALAKAGIKVDPALIAKGAADLKARGN